MQPGLADEALAAFQEAALFPERWPDALGVLTRTFGSRGAMVQMVGAGGYRVEISPSLEASLDEFIRGGWHEVNQRMHRGLTLMRRGHQGFATEYHMFSRDELARDPYEQEFAPLHGVEAEAGILLASHQGASLVLTASRSAKAGPYTPGELVFMNALVARLADAASLATRLKLGQSIATAGALAACGGAIALLSRNGFSLFHSAATEALFGDVLVLRQGCLAAAEPQSDRCFQHALGHASTWRQDSPVQIEPVALKRASGPPVIARLHPIAGAARDFLGLAKTILTLDDLAERAPSPLPGLLSEAFGLTPAEARLACRLAWAATLREAASAERITYESARTRLKTIFDKTGVNTQAALTALVGRLG